MHNCEFCGKPTTMPFHCSHCDGFFCGKHRIPENHNCSVVGSAVGHSKGRGSTRVPVYPKSYPNKTKKRGTPSEKRYRYTEPRRISKKIKILLLCIILLSVYTGGNPFGGKYSFFNSNIKMPTYKNTIDTLNKYSVGIENKIIESKNKLSEYAEESQKTTSRPSYVVSSPRCSVITIQYNYKSTEADSRQIIEYLNQIRTENGKKNISFDKRVFDLAVARAEDMRNYSYLDHTNPYTGTCPSNMKSDYGLKPGEYVAENALGNPEYSEDKCTEIRIKSMKEAITSWMTSRGHRYNLLYDTHVAGAVGCYKNMCTFLGLNYDRFGEGCHTADEGEAYWDSAPLKPDEDPYIFKKDQDKIIVRIIE